MVGIVLVSHSKNLAEAACKLALQAAPAAQIVGVGGAGDDGEDFGTDATQILNAIEEVYCDDGVIVIMDMGSALLSTETALALLGEERSEKIKMSSAPFIEGAISAAVQSSINSDLQTIIAELNTALSPKQHQIGDVPQGSVNLSPGSDTGKTVQIPADAIQKKFTITNEHGLHARPAALFVQEMSGFKSDVYIAHERNIHNVVSSKSLNAIILLNFRKGDRIVVCCWGEDAQEVLLHVETLILEEFGEKDLESLESDNEVTAYFEEDYTGQTEEQLVSVSPGISIAAPLCVVSHQPVFDCIHTENIEEELILFDQKLAAVQKDIDKDMKSMDDRDTAEILKMQSAMLSDPDLHKRIRDDITTKQHIFEYSMWEICTRIAGEYKKLDNTYLQARNEDFMDISKRFLRNSRRVELKDLDFRDIEEPKILFIDEVGMETVSKINPDIITGIVASKGGKESHAAIIARTRGIPMVLGFKDIASVKQIKRVVLNANIPKLIFDPDKTEMVEINKILESCKALKKKIEAEILEPARCRDRMPMSCLANVGTLNEVNGIRQQGAQGIGLFRTEFLFLNRAKPPSPEQQYKIYKKTLDQISPYPVTVRILDIGGDKPISYLPQITEDNPFLGLRGIRLDLKYKKLLTVQLKALFRAASNKGNLRIMLPMIVDEGELIEFKNICDQVSQDLSHENIAHNRNIPIGVMIETPAAGIRSSELSQQADFFSVGTNDLTQYILAAERGNMNVSYLYDHCHPAVLAALNSICQNSNNIDISICGEMSSDLEALPLLIGMGVRTLSMSPRNIGVAKYLIGKLLVKDCLQILHHALQLSSAKEIRTLVCNNFPDISLLKGINT